MWYSSRDDVNRCWIQPSKDMSADRRGIRPSMDTSTYRHRDVGYGHSPKYDNAHRVQHRFITPGQHRHINISHRKSIHQPNFTPSLLPVLFVLLQRKKIIFKLFFYSSLKVTGDVKQNAQYNLPFFNLKPEKGEKLKTFLILKQDWLWPFSKLHIGVSWILWKVLMEFKKNCQKIKFVN